jgi:transposase
MRQRTEVTKPSSEKVIKDIRRATRKQYGAEEKIRIVLDGLRVNGGVKSGHAAA